MASDSASGNLTSWLNIAGLSPPSLSPAAAVAAAAAAAVGSSSMAPTDQCVRLMLDERRTTGDGDQLMAGLGRRPTVGLLYSEDGRNVMSAAIRPTAVDAASAAGNDTCSVTVTAVLRCSSIRDRSFEGPAVCDIDVINVYKRFYKKNKNAF